MWKWYLSRPPETRSHIARLSKKALTLIKSALQYKIQIKSRQFCTLRSCTDKSYFIKCTSYDSWTCKNCTRIRICKICSELAHRWGDILVNFDPCINEIFPYYWTTIASIIFFSEQLSTPTFCPWETAMRDQMTFDSKRPFHMHILSLLGMAFWSFCVPQSILRKSFNVVSVGHLQ